MGFWGRIITAFACIVAASSTSVPARAAGIPFDVFLSSAEGRYLLLRAPGTDEFLARLAGITLTEASSREELLDAARARLELPEYSAEREAIEDRFKKIQDRYASAPASEQGEGDELSRGQMLLLNELAERLRINPEWRPGTESGRMVDFFASSPADTFENTRATFLRDAPDPAIHDDGSSVPAAERPGAKARMERYVADMKTCLAEKPPAEMMRINYKYMLTQLMTDEAMTVGGAIVAAGGVHGVDWKTLPNDLAFEAFASLGDSLIATMPRDPAAKYDVRWFRMQGFGVAQSGADAVIYAISQSKPNVSTSERLAFNAAWNAGYAKISIALYDLIAGLECLNASSAVVVGTQIGAGLGANLAYFGLRNHFLGSNSD
jgi:hypothetical protein